MLTNTTFILFGFFATFFSVIIVSFYFVEVIKSFSIRFSFSKTFIGSFLLSFGTSFPELTNTIVAGIYDKTYRQESSEGIFYSINAFYNLTGANIIQIVFLALSVIFFGIHLLKKNQKDDYLSFVRAIFTGKLVIWALVFCEVLLLINFVIFNSFFKQLEVGGINLFSFVFLIVWVVYFFITFFEKKEKDEEIEVLNKKVFLSSFNNFYFLLFGFFIWSIFALLSCANFWIVSQFDKSFNIPKNIGLGIILSLITSTPEFTSFFFLVKKKSYKLATLGFLGSSLFNLTLPCIMNLISGIWIFSDDAFNVEKNKILIWLFTDLAINISFIFGFLAISEKLHKKPIYFSFLIFIIYAISNISIFLFL